MTGGHGATHGDEGVLIHNARVYEMGARIAFLGRRRRVFDRLVREAGIRPGDRVLDVGCGTGYFARRASAAAGPDGHVVGVDPSAAVVDYARRKLPAGTFHVAAAQAIPEPDGTFDVVVSSLAIHHIPPDDRPAAFAEFRRVLRPDGRLLVADLRPRRGVLGGRHGHGTAVDLAALVRAAGLRVTGGGTTPVPKLQYVRAEP